MRVTLQGERVALDDSMLLGEGGEARVFRHPHLPLALKVYTAPGAGTDRRQFDTLMALRQKKLRALLSPQAAAVLPPEAVRPVATLENAKGDFIGYAMQAIAGAVDLATLARPDRALDANGVLSVFALLSAAVARIHAAGFVIGDLNDGNVVLQRAAAPHIIDVDSWQVGALPCPVAHERFLDPRLYGADLGAACAFSAQTDAYALRVLLFQSLLFVHPYGGVHPAHKTLLRRAEARHSVLRGDVTLPRRALSPDILPDVLRADFERAFDGDVRAPFVLPTVSFLKCSCGLVHGRNACPACRVVVVKPAVRVAGHITAETLVEARSAVLAACAIGGRIVFIIDDNGTVRREDRSQLLPDGRDGGTRFALATGGTWLARGGQLGFVPLGASAPSMFVHADTWCAAQAGLFVLEGDAVVAHETRTRVARVVAGATQLFGSFADTTHAGIALYRVGSVLRGMWFGRGAPTDLPALPVGGRIAELAVSFGDDRALIGVAFDEQGVRVHALFVVDARGQLLAAARGRPDEQPLLGAIRGFCLSHGKVLAPTSEGVIAFSCAHGAFVERARFVGTEGFVDASCELLPSAGGELVVVDARSIVKLRMGRSEQEQRRKPEGVGDASKLL